MYWINIVCAFEMHAWPRDRGRSDYYVIASNIFEEDINKVEESFLNAAWEGDLVKIENLLSKRRSLVFNIDARDSFGNTALLRSIVNHHYKISKLLIKHGCDVTVSNKNNESLANFSMDACVSLLLDSWTEGSTNIRLCKACWLANSQQVNSILKSEGCNVNCRNIDGLTPLLLLVCGLKSFNSMSHLLSSSYSYSPIDALLSLINNGCNVNAVDSVSNYGAVHFLASFDHVTSCRMMELLIKNKYIIGVRDVIERTGLHVAAEVGNFSILKLLIHSGLSIHATDSHQNTPLHYAAKCGHLLIASYLLSLGACTDVTNDEGLTPLELAPPTSTCRSLLVRAINKQNDIKLAEERMDIAKRRLLNVKHGIAVNPTFDTPAKEIKHDINVLEKKIIEVTPNNDSKSILIEKKDHKDNGNHKLEKEFCIESTWLDRSSDSGYADIVTFDYPSSHDSNNSCKISLSPILEQKNLTSCLKPDKRTIRSIENLEAELEILDSSQDAVATTYINIDNISDLNNKNVGLLKKVAFINSSIDEPECGDNINFTSPTSSFDLSENKTQHNSFEGTNNCSKISNQEHIKNPKFMTIKYCDKKIIDKKLDLQNCKSKYQDVCNTNKELYKFKEGSFSHNKLQANSNLLLANRIKSTTKTSENVTSPSIFLNRFQFDISESQNIHQNVHKGPVIIDPFESLKLRRQMEKDTQEISPRTKTRLIGKQTTVSKSGQLRNRVLLKGLGAKAKSSGDLLSEGNLTDNRKLNKRFINDRKKKKVPTATLR